MLICYIKIEEITWPALKSVNVVQMTKPVKIYQSILKPLMTLTLINDTFVFSMSVQVLVHLELGLLHGTSFYPFIMTENVFFISMSIIMYTLQICLHIHVYLVLLTLTLTRNDI